MKALTPDEKALVKRRTDQLRGQKAAKTRQRQVKEAAAGQCALLPWMVLCAEYEAESPKRISHEDLARFASTQARTKVSKQRIKAIRDRDDYQEYLQHAIAGRREWVTQAMDRTIVPEAIKLYRASLSEANRRLETGSLEERATLDLAKNMPLVNPALERAMPKKPDGTAQVAIINVQLSPKQQAALDMTPMDTEYEILPVDDSGPVE